MAEARRAISSALSPPGQSDEQATAAARAVADAHPPNHQHNCCQTHHRPDRKMIPPVMITGVSTNQQTYLNTQPSDLKCIRRR